MSIVGAAERWRAWRAPDAWRRILTVDAHTAGEPLRVIFAGLPDFRGDTVLERRRDALRHHDALRTALMWEPRGHTDMYGCILMPPASDGSDFAVLFTHNAGYSTMCGHGIIAVTTVVLEVGLLPAVEPRTTLRIDTPAGLVVANADVEAGHVRSVVFRNVPSFVAELDGHIDVPGLGDVRFDLAYGGAFYAYVDAAQLDLSIEPENAAALVDAGMAIKHALSDSRFLYSPDNPDLAFLYGTIFTGAAHSPDAHSRNVCIFAEGEVDRSPTGTGVSGRAAIHYARGELRVGETIVIESIIGSRFAVRVAEELREDERTVVIPEVEGSAWITGRHEFLLDPSDPMWDGFLVR